MKYDSLLYAWEDWMSVSLIHNHSCFDTFAFIDSLYTVQVILFLFFEFVQF